MSQVTTVHVPINISLTVNGVGCGTMPVGWLTLQVLVPQQVVERHHHHHHYLPAPPQEPPPPNHNSLTNGLPKPKNPFVW